MKQSEQNKKIAMEFMCAINTFERDAYEPFLADEPVYWVGMNRQVGKEAIHANIDAARVLYPQPEAATTEVLASVAEGNWVAVLLIRRSPTNLVASYENMYALFYEVIDGKIATLIENLDMSLVAQSFDFSALFTAVPGSDPTEVES